MTKPTGKPPRHAKLSDEKAREIRALYGTACTCCGHPIGTPALARRFGVSVQAIHYVIKGRSYAPASQPEIEA